MDESIHLGRNIRTIRLLLGIKQDLFALRLGIAQPNVSQLEKKGDISPDRLSAVAQALGVSVEAIKAFDENALLQTLTNLNISASTSVQGITNYYKDELARKDAQIADLMSQLAKK